MKKHDKKNEEKEENCFESTEFGRYVSKNGGMLKSSEITIVPKREEDNKPFYFLTTDLIRAHDCPFRYYPHSGMDAGREERHS